MPPFPLVPLSLALASLKTGLNLFRVHIGDAVKSLGARPLMLVSGAEDPRMTPELGNRLLGEAVGPADHLVIAGADHAQCWSLGKAEYEERVLGLLEATWLNQE